jgi:CRISPR/Cas system-associated endonuclease Cas3-HD
MKKSLCLLLFICVLSCVDKKENKVIIQENKAYQQSEMAALMLSMYQVNLENKKLILEGKSPEKYHQEFSKIHTAKLTDSTDRNAAFKGFSDFYLKNYKMLFETPKDSLKFSHNNTINSCIACHKTTCIGPIPKIKKLLIKE